jgi:hypothetical protein
MTNTHVPTLPELQAAYEEAVEWSNRFFDEQSWTMAEQWHLTAVELLNELRERQANAVVQH